MGCSRVLENLNGCARLQILYFYDDGPQNPESKGGNIGRYTASDLGILNIQQPNSPLEKTTSTQTLAWHSTMFYTATATLRR